MSMVTASISMQPIDNNAVAAKLRAKCATYRS